jgi:hypothetical protein
MGFIGVCRKINLPLAGLNIVPALKPLSALALGTTPILSAGWAKAVVIVLLLSVLHTSSLRVHQMG